MKRLVSLIILVGIFFVSIFLTVQEPVYAFCIYNKTEFSIEGNDTRKQTILDKYWQGSIKSGEKACCPGNNKECQNAKIYLQDFKSGTCEVSVDAHGWIVAHSNNSGSELFCNINEPM